MSSTSIMHKVDISLHGWHCSLTITHEVLTSTTNRKAQPSKKLCPFDSNVYHVDNAQVFNKFNFIVNESLSLWTMICTQEPTGTWRLIYQLFYG